jgi:hypothetical protein
VHLCIPSEEPQALRALYNSGAEINLVNRQVSAHIEVAHITNLRKPQAMFLDDKELQIHRAHQLTLNCPNSAGAVKQVSPQVF